MSIEQQLKQIEWIGSSLEDLKEFPKEVCEVIGYALYFAQTGGKHPSAKPLKGFTGAGILEIVEDYDGDTYRAVYTVKLASRVYVLHVFQKKSKHGISTPQQDIDLVKERLKRAKLHHDSLSSKAKVVKK
jgi:phage-related protein